MDSTVIHKRILPEVRGITQFGNNLAIPTHGDPIFKKHKKSAHWFEKFSLDCLDFQANNVEK